MYPSRPARLLLRIGTAITLAFLYAPLVVIAIYAFNPRRTLGWPTGGVTFEWFDRAFHNPGLRDALWMSVKVATHWATAPPASDRGTAATSIQR